MTPVEPQQQLEFLSNVQRLLSEGLFTATYKYALLLAVADICVEDGEDDGAPFVIPTTKIAEKFIAYYWPQVRPYEGAVLRQNTGKTPTVISALGEVVGEGVVALHGIRRDASAWRDLVRKASTTPARQKTTTSPTGWHDKRTAPLRPEPLTKTSPLPGSALIPGSTWGRSFNSRFRMRRTGSFLDRPVEASR